MLNSRRFMRTGLLLGEEGLRRLHEASVMVVGLGAVGGYALEGLARAGVGRLILVDFDTFDETNINRQILALTSTIGKKKTDVAAQRVKEINPDCIVETKDVFVNTDTIEDLLREPVDFVVDAIDALNPKCCLMQTLQEKGIPFISSMGAALKSDPSFIRLGALSKTKNCGLAKFIRKRLKKRGVDINKITCVSSEEQVNLPETAIMESEDKTQESGRIRNTLGSLPTITAIFGLTIANAVIKQLTANK
ncbi:MAG: ThiF family adenylyltransferase [Alphaproteobacteria bacterium]